MTLDTFVLGSLERLWHYGPPSSLPLHNTIINSSCATSTSCCSVSSDPIANARQSTASQGTGWLQSLFAMMDEDGDGQLSLRPLLAKFGISAQYNDLASLVESSRLTPNLHQHTSFFSAPQDCPTQHPAHKGMDDGFDDELLDIFQVYDMNHDGFISAAELAAVMLNLGLLPDHCGLDAHLATCQAYIDSADLDGNGLVDLGEFKSMMMYNHPATSGFSSSSFS